VKDSIGADPVKESGPNNFFFCVFHGEKKAPSLNINTSTNAFKCFGCHEHGDSIKWMQKFHSMSYGEAIEHLSSTYAIDISAYVRSPTQEEAITDRYVNIFNSVGEWCHTQLKNNESVLTWYKNDTGFDDDTIEAYKIGYSPSINALMSFLSAKYAISQDDVRKLELDYKSLFENTLTYPIHDLSGDTYRIYAKQVAPTEQHGPKYKGTSNAHPLFKRGLVYGLYQVRKSLRANGYRIVLCEGFKACVAAGGVAVMGTNISDEQVETLKSAGVKSVLACFDGDQAGYLASMRLVDDMAKFRGLFLKIARMPMDTQCDTLVRVSGRTALDAVIANAEMPIEFAIKSKYGGVANFTLEQKSQLLFDMAPLIARMQDVEIDITCDYLASVLGSTQNSISTFIRDIKISTSKLYNNKAEDTVIHNIIIDPKNWSKVKALNFTVDHFAQSETKFIFAAIFAAYKEHDTSITARVIHDKVELLYPVDKDRIIRKIDKIVSMQPEYKFDVALEYVQDLWLRRTCISQSTTLQTALQDLNNTPNAAIQKFRRSSVSIVDVGSNQASIPQSVADKVDRIIHERMASDSRIVGYDFGSALPVLNMTMSGLQPGHQFVIAANSGVGKSLLALNMIKPIVMQQRKPWLWIASEMDEVELAMRMYSLESGISNTRIQLGQFTDIEEYNKYCEARDTYAQSTLIIKKPQMGTIDEVYSIIEEHVFRYGIVGVTWDYIQLVMASKDQRGMSKEEVISEATTIMTNKVAKQLNLVSMCISQLNRTGFQKGAIREAENMAGSYKISQDADDLITISEKTQEQIEEHGIQKGNRVIYVDKRRGGPSNVAINAMLDDKQRASLRFTECCTPQEVAGFNISHDRTPEQVVAAGAMSHGAQTPANIIKAIKAKQLKAH
jgi:DNA primase catalytic core